MSSIWQTCLVTVRSLSRFMWYIPFATIASTIFSKVNHLRKTSACLLLPCVNKKLDRPFYCSVTWPLERIFFWYRSPYFCCVYQVVLYNANYSTFAWEKQRGLCQTWFIQVWRPVMQRLFQDFLTIFKESVSTGTISHFFHSHSNKGEDCTELAVFTTILQNAK